MNKSKIQHRAARFTHHLSATLVLLMLAASAAHASDPVSLNIVGYANTRFYPGDNLIANQFIQFDNSLNTVLTNGTAAGSTLTMWDSVANTFLPLSLFDGTTWSINYTLNPGQGALLNSPVMATNVFVGTVPIYTNILSGDPFLAGTGWHPNYPNGLHLLSVPEPMTASGDNLFHFVTDRSPLDGEWIRTLDPSTQTYRTTTYHTGSGWDNGDPAVDVGQAAWFGLGPVAVPEPSTSALALSVGLPLLFRRLKAKC
jgi:hypothetical protein